jgi:hypothetical protein
MNITLFAAQPLGSAPGFSNIYVTFWSLLNFLIPIAILLLIYWYVKQNIQFRKQVLEKLDYLISLQSKKSGNE